MTSQLTRQPASLLTSSTTTNNTYGHYTSFSTSHLPEPPRTLKNRYMDAERDRLMTSNEAYGKYWQNTPRSAPDDAVTPGGGEDRPAGLGSHSTRRDEPMTKRMPSKDRSVEAVWNGGAAASVDVRPLAEPAGVVASYSFTGRSDHPRNSHQGSTRDNIDEQFPTESDWPYGRNISQRRPPLPPIGSDTGSSLSRRLLPTFDDGGLSSKGNNLLTNAGKYRVSVGLNGGITAADIRGIDLQLRLNDNSTVTIRSVPFSYE